MKKILCFGDSNTWGYIPGEGSRYDENTRWTSLLQKMLGPEYMIIEDGINGRTSSFDDPWCDFRNGRRSLPYALAAGFPLDGIIIMLGTNDLKFTGANGCAKGIASVLSTVNNYKALLQPTNAFGDIFNEGARKICLSPINLGKGIDNSYDSQLQGMYSESLKIAEYLKGYCDVYGFEFMDAADYAEPSEIDSVHLTPEGHSAIARAVYEKLTGSIA